ncbi:LysM peptidoglycan-binding domain-containing protein [Sagittula sp. SSi028]|uniref:LysM peptidoglycan-binding domain-containing protein n=1 Tax=Sagittula sp. SSi028 TaxID=3400636 RepID=UPI003AF53395
MNSAIGGVAVAGAVGVAIATGVLTWPADEPQEAASVAVVPDTVPSAPSEDTTGSDSVAVQPEIVPDAPVLAMRLMPGSSVMVTGTSAPGDLVEVLFNGAPVAEVETEGDGSYATLIDLPEAAPMQLVRARATGQDGVPRLSQTELIIPASDGGSVDLASVSPDTPNVPQASPDDQVPNLQADSSVARTSASAVSVPAQEDSAAPVPKPQVGDGMETPDAPATQNAPSETVGTSAAPDVVQALAAPAEPDADTALPTTETANQPAAPRILVAGPEGVEALDKAPLSPSGVALDSISYDSDGDVILAGRGQDEAFVRVYLNNEALVTSPIAGDGAWDVALPDVDTGTYTLRVDQVDAEGTVIARVESPFLREDPALLEELSANGGPVTEITVQPGHSLWAISEDRYGNGIEYVKIFDANRERIRDPDLIYPGQIFDLPDGLPDP